MFKDIFSFHGRIRRTEWGISLIIYFIAYLISIGLLTWSSDISSSGLFFSLLSLIPLIWFILAQATKRCHDVGKSGWWQFVPFYIIALIFVEGNKGNNEYGVDPKR